MKRYLYSIIIGLLIFETACVEDVLIEVDPAPPKIVVSSLFIPDSIIIVTATRSFSALSGKNLQALEDDLINSLLLDRALVTISSDTQTDTLFKLSPGVFVGALKDARPYDVFELNIFDSLTMSSARSVTELKEQVRFDSVSLNREVSNGDTTSFLYYQFRDPAEDENWYLVQGFELPRLPNFDNVQFDVENGDVILSPDTSNQVFFQPDVTLLFSDLISDLTLENDTVKSREELGFYQPRDTVVFVMINIDEGYYDFLQARKRSGGILQSLTREPVNHPSNVENGYGYFTMHLPHFRAFVREED
ncbi:MAG: DUF4249 family protein [Cyclobacteriaceae bacterium]